MANNHCITYYCKRCDATSSCFRDTTPRCRDVKLNQRHGICEFMEQPMHSTNSVPCRIHGLTSYANCYLCDGGENTVDHPPHYGGADNPYEVIKVMEAWLTPEEFRGALKFNIHKYLARAAKKAGPEDQAKAAWYAKYLDEWEQRVGQQISSELEKK